MTNKARLIEIVMMAPDDRSEAIVAAAQGTTKPRPCNIKMAAEVGGCNRRTIQRYAQQGLLTPIRISARRVRYDLNQVEQLFTRGAVAVKIVQAEQFAQARQGAT